MTWMYSTWRDYFTTLGWIVAIYVCALGLCLIIAIGISR